MSKLLYQVGGLFALLAAFIYYYPSLFCVIVFVAYSLILVLLGRNILYFLLIVKLVFNVAFFRLSRRWYRFRAEPLVGPQVCHTHLLRTGSVVQGYSVGGVVGSLMWTQLLLTLISYRSPIFDRLKPIQIASHLPIIFGRTVDGLILQIIEYTFRDFVAPWLGYAI